jgi:hypothetical protein
VLVLGHGLRDGGCHVEVYGALTLGWETCPSNPITKDEAIVKRTASLIAGDEVPRNPLSQPQRIPFDNHPTRKGVSIAHPASTHSSGQATCRHVQIA